MKEFNEEKKSDANIPYKKVPMKSEAEDHKKEISDFPYKAVPILIEEDQYDSEKSLPDNNKKLPLPLKENQKQEKKEDSSEDSFIFEDSSESYKKRVMFKEKKISLMKILVHFSEGMDKFIMILGIIGAIGSGFSLPISAYLTGEIFSEVGKN